MPDRISAKMRGAVAPRRRRGGRRRRWPVTSLTGVPASLSDGRGQRHRLRHQRRAVRRADRACTSSPARAPRPTPASSSTSRSTSTPTATSCCCRSAPSRAGSTSTHARRAAEDRRRRIDAVRSAPKYGYRADTALVVGAEPGRARAGAGSGVLRVSITGTSIYGKLVVAVGRQGRAHARRSVHGRSQLRISVVRAGHPQELTRARPPSPPRAGRSAARRACAVAARSTDSAASSIAAKRSSASAAR